MKIRMLQLLAFISSIAPLGVYVGLNWEQYAPSTYETVKLGIGGAVVGFIFLMKALKKANLPKGLFGWMVALGIAWALQAILADLVQILMWATIGEGIDEVIIEPQIERLIENKKMQNQSTLIATTLQQMQSGQGSGRV